MQVDLLQNAMLVAGIVTLVQLFAIGPVGGKVPIIMGTLSLIHIYNSGRKLATGFADSIAPITEAASILGLTVVGALIPSVINYKTNLQFAFGEVTFALQDMLDKILPSLLPLGIVMLSYWLLGKKKVNSTRLIFILIALGMVLGNLQAMLTALASLF